MKIYIIFELYATSRGTNVPTTLDDLNARKVFEVYSDPIKALDKVQALNKSVANKIYAMEVHGMVE